MILKTYFRLYVLFQLLVVIKVLFLPDIVVITHSVRVRRTDLSLLDCWHFVRMKQGLGVTHSDRGIQSPNGIVPK